MCCPDGSRLVDFTISSDVNLVDEGLGICMFPKSPLMSKILIPETSMVSVVVGVVLLCKKDLVGCLWVLMLFFDFPFEGSFVVKQDCLKYV